MQLDFINVLQTTEYILFGYFVVYSLYAVATGLASRSLVKQIYKKRDKCNVTESELSEHPVTIIVPAFNEEVTIRNTILNLSRLQHPSYEIIVVNDGSTDATLSELVSLFEGKFPAEYTPVITGDIPTKKINGYMSLDINGKKVTIIDKENGGKADAFNSALNIITTGHVITIDADTLLVKDALKQLMVPVIKNSNVVAVGAQVGVMNNGTIDDVGRITSIRLPNHYLQGVQALEYLKTFLIYRTGHDYFNASLLISGACGLFNTNLLKAVGGFDTNSVCEDIDITIRIQEYIRSQDKSETIQFIPDPVAWTEVPSTFRSLAKQRNRWFRGAAQTLWNHKSMILRPSFGYVGMYSMPSYWLFGYFTPYTQLLATIYLALHFAGVLSFGALAPMLLYGLLVSSVINIIAISIMKFTNSPIRRFKDKLKLFWFGIVEVLFVQFIYMVINLKAAFDAARGQRHWNKFNRVGYTVRSETNA